jgi:hypothetical protein
MQWNDVRKQFPHQWLLIEAIDAHSEDGRRIVDRLAVVENFPDSENSSDAMRAYEKLHEQAPERELYVFHSDREELDIRERVWWGIRTGRVAR